MELGFHISEDGCVTELQAEFYLVDSHTLQVHLTSPTAVILWETLPAKSHREKLPKNNIMLGKKTCLIYLEPMYFFIFAIQSLIYRR